MNQPSSPPPQPEVTPVRLTEEVAGFVNGAGDNGTPFVFAYVDDRGRPNLSFWATTQAFSDDELALWVRNAEGGFLKALAANEHVAFIALDYPTMTNAYFRGRARIELSQEARERVYSNSPERERNSDPEMKGVCVVVAIDEAQGRLPEGRFRMRRAL